MACMPAEWSDWLLWHLHGWDEHIWWVNVFQLTLDNDCQWLFLCFWYIITKIACGFCLNLNPCWVSHNSWILIWLKLTRKYQSTHFTIISITINQTRPCRLVTVSLFYVPIWYRSIYSSNELPRMERPELYDIRISTWTQTYFKEIFSIYRSTIIDESECKVLTTIID